MYTVTGYLYKDDRLLLRGMWEDLESFVEELKELNPNFVDRRTFKIITVDGCGKENEKTKFILYLYLSKSR